MSEQFSRTEMLLGKTGMDRLAKSRIAVFGIGGVGGYVCEALARSGVGALDLIDNDRVCLSNVNRQIIATVETVGKYKVDVMKARILSINPLTVVRSYPAFFLPENSGEFPFSEYDYVVDAVDTVTAKLELVMKAKETGVPIISSMGTGNKLDAGRLKVADIYETKVCPLARVMRRELKKRGIDHLKVVYSEEEPLKPDYGPDTWSSGRREDDWYKDKQIEDNPSTVVWNENAGKQTVKKAVPGSTAFVPPVAGMIIAGEVVKDLTGR